MSSICNYITLTVNNISNDAFMMEMNSEVWIFMNSIFPLREYDSIENMQLPEIPIVIKIVINDSHSN